MVYLQHYALGKRLNG